MCGIAGSINFDIDQNTIFKALSHRGPDDQASFLGDTVALYHTRLAIQDVAGGAQPMEYQDCVLAYNGEIYNHQALRKKFNLDCRTESDTETLLHLYKKIGWDCLHELDGMFALALYDKTLKRLFLVRDRAGKKPLYFYRQGERLVFASELNALRDLLALEVDDDNINTYLRTGIFFQDQTPYQSVSELGQGTLLDIRIPNVDISEKKWWDIKDHYQNKSKLSLEDEVNKVESLLQSAVRSRLVSSDLEVGAFLSGGIDSGLICSIAASEVSNLKTFTVSFGGGYDEAPLAKSVADRYGTDHTEIRIDFGDLEDDIEGIIGNYGEPYADSSAVPSYYVSREAKKHVTVVLNGDGADELFAGYKRYVPYSKFNLFSSNPITTGLAKLATAVLPDPSEKQSYYNLAYRLAALASHTGAARYFSTTNDVFVGYEHLLGASSNQSRIDRDYAEIARKDNSSLQKLMMLDFEAQLGATLLPKMDIASMRHSLEARSPFLCKELLEYAPSIADNFKINGVTTKHLLRELARKRLPISVVEAPKRGFEIPLKQWVDGELNTIINDYLSPSNASIRAYLKPGTVDALLDGSLKLPLEKRAKMIWNLFTAEIWFQRVYLRS